MNDLVSVIIPAFNAELFIKETILSVLNQSYSNLECIVIDDGSPDRLGEVAKELLVGDPRLRYIKQENAGVSKARNYGYSISRGDFIAFLDADDVWLPDRLAKMIEKFNEDKYGLVHTDMEFIDELSSLIGKRNSGKEGFVLDDLLLWNECVIPAPSSILLKREVLKTVGAFDTDLSTAADQEFFFRVAAKYKVGKIESTFGLYRTHSANMSKNVALMQMDHKKAYDKALSNKLFKNSSFKRKCYSNMYIIIAGCWWGDGNDKLKSLLFILKSILCYPKNIQKIVSKLTHSD